MGVSKSGRVSRSVSKSGRSRTASGYDIEQGDAAVQEGKKKGGCCWVIIVAVILILLLAGAGIWWCRTKNVQAVQPAATDQVQEPAKKKSTEQKLRDCYAKLLAFGKKLQEDMNGT